jgi:glycosyltransferase involved in cell wall biosynthesis
MPDISIIIPTHNRLWALPQAIDSCRSDSCLIEVIVVDDGSTDGTWSWLQTLKDVKSVRTEQWGKCWAANAGFALSTGEFVRFLDSDDWIIPGANENQLRIARSTQADVVVSGFTSLELSGAKVEMPWPQCDDFIALAITMYADCHYSAFLMRRSFISGIPLRQESVPFDDDLFMIELAIARPRLEICETPAIMRREHAAPRLSEAGGLDSTLAVWRTIWIYRKALALLRERGEFTEQRKHIVLAAMWVAARRLSESESTIRDAVGVTHWIYEQDHAFVPPVRRIVAYSYQAIGFAMTERILRIRRRLLRRFENVFRTATQPSRRS